MNTTGSQLRQQWENPSDILTILMIIGGDVVQKALGQTAGGWFTPTCFSFGWVACSFSMLVNVLGDGRLLPLPDVNVKAFNLESGYRRENRNWVVGRLLRDLELELDESEKSKETRRLRESQKLTGSRMLEELQKVDDNIFRIGVYVADPLVQRTSIRPQDRVQVLWAVTTLMQLIVAAVPLILYREWSTFLITAVGTLGVFCTGVLPQWTVEKMPARRRANKDVALTSGNGARTVIVIRGVGEALDLEDLAAAPSPLERRAWGIMGAELPRYYHRSGFSAHKAPVNYGKLATTWKGFPMGFWITRVAISCLCIFWILLLLTVAGMKTRTWYLIAVGAIGMLQNAYAASARRTTQSWNLNLRPEYTLCGKKVMDVLMDFEAGNAGKGRVLLDEFFPGPLRSAEVKWWSGLDRWEYDNQRLDQNRDIDQMQKERSKNEEFTVMEKASQPQNASPMPAMSTTVANESITASDYPRTMKTFPERAEKVGSYDEIDHKDIDLESPYWA